MALRATDTNFKPLYTAAEFEKMPQFHERYELINGEIKEKPAPTFDQSEIRNIIRLYLYEFDRAETFGLMRHSVSVKISPDYTPLPDLSYWMAANKPPRGQKGASPRPDLAVEIKSPGQSLRSLEDKAKEYIQAGVQLVWIIQPTKQKVRIYRPNQAKPEELGLSDTLSGENVIKNFTMSVAALFQTDDTGNADK